MRKREPIEGGVLSPDVRMSDTDHPGVVHWGDGWRIALTLDARWYRVQIPAETEDGVRWISPRGRGGALSKAVQRLGDDLPGLREAAAALPDEPAEAAPEFAAAARELRRLFNVTRFDRDASPFEVVRWLNWRVLIDPHRERYIAQRVTPYDRTRSDAADVDVGNVWETVAARRTISKLRNASANVRPVVWEGDARTHARVCERARLACLDELERIAPEVAADGQWPDMPRRPSGRVRRRAQRAPESRQSGESAAQAGGRAKARRSG